MFKKKQPQISPWPPGTFFSGMGEDFLGVIHSWALLMNLAHPEVDDPLNVYKLTSNLTSSEVKKLLESYKRKEISVDQLFQIVFETKLSYREFIEQQHKHSNRLEVTSLMCERLSAEKWTQEWSSELLNQEINPFVRDCIGNLGNTKASHAGFRIDSWDFEDWWSTYYFRSALIGFKALASVFNQGNGEFGWIEGDVNRQKIHNIACGLKLTSPEPLYCLQTKQIDDVKQKAQLIAEELKVRLKPDWKGLSKIDDTILLAACDGARIALIGIDPSSVQCFEGGRQLDVSEFPWYQESIEKEIMKRSTGQSFIEPF